jgi:hypothetical protein
MEFRFDHRVRILSGMRLLFVVAAMILVTSCSEKPQSAAVSASGTAPPRVTASDPRVVYELREKCGKDAQAWYHHYWEEDHTAVKDVRTIGSGFNSHYNERLNKCFVVVSSTTSTHDSTTKATRFLESVSLTDVLENKDLGDFMKSSDMSQPWACGVGDSKCDSQQGFEALIASFMKE